METKQLNRYKKILKRREKRRNSKNKTVKTILSVEEFLRLGIIRPVTDGFYCACRSVRWNLIRRGILRRNDNERALEALRDSHEGETAFIIGNGPSLYMEDLDLLHRHGAYSFACNRIGLAFDDTDWRPDCYAACDRKLLLSGTFIEDILLDGHCDYYFFGGNFFKCLPREMKQENVLRLEEKPNNPRKTETRFSTEPEKYLINGYTVVNLLIQMAVFMGFTTICLLGIDCKYACVTDAKGNITYDNKVEKVYFKVKDDGENKNCAFVSGMMQTYAVAKKYAQEHGLDIYNCSKESQLELFEHRDLREVLGTDSKKLVK